MEVICKRIPTLAEKVFKNLSDQDLIKCKESSREFYSFLNDEQFFAKRIISAHYGNFIQFQDVWNKVIDKTPKEIVVQLARAVQDFFSGDESRFGMQWPPFWIAAERGNRQLFEEMIQRSGDISTDGLHGLNAALFMVAEKGHTEVCNLIVRRLVDKNPSNNNGWTPFHNAARNGHVDVCRLLMKNIANKNPGDNTGWTPLHEAARYGKIEVCKIILFLNIEKNPRCTSGPGDTVLHTAALFGHLDIYKLISKYVNDRTPARNDGATPLHWASQNGSLQICEYIVEKVGNKDLVMNNGLTPLHSAAGRGRLEVCKFLMEKGAKKDARDNTGLTPLHYAAYYGHFEVCKFIAANVDDKDPKDNSGRTPSSLMNDFLKKNVFITKP